VSDRLYGIRQKIRRAEEHIRALQQREVEFSQANPPSIRLEYDDRLQGMKLLVQKICTPPNIISILIGEVLYQLRSSLDHLIWQLIEANGNTPTDRSEFPIFKDSKKFKAGGAKIRGVSRTAASIIEVLQPFHSGKGVDDPLWILHNLNNIDKHRVLLVTVGGFGLTYPGIQISDDVIRFPTPTHLVGVLRLSTEEDILFFFYPTENREMRVETARPIPTSLVFDRGVTTTVKPVIPLLSELAAYVGIIVDKFMGEVSAASLRNRQGL
jgi:hypothetical protein